MNRFEFIVTGQLLFGQSWKNDIARMLGFSVASKIVAKIRVIDVDSWGIVSFFSSFLRSVGRIFSEMFFYVGFLIGFFNEGRRTFHDITGKTLVVNV